MKRLSTTCLKQGRSAMQRACIHMDKKCVKCRSLLHWHEHLHTALARTSRTVMAHGRPRLTRLIPRDVATDSSGCIRGCSIALNFNELWGLRSSRARMFACHCRVGPLGLRPRGSQFFCKCNSSGRPGAHVHGMVWHGIVVHAESIHSLE